MFGGHGAKKGMVGRQARTEKADTTWPIFQDSGLAGGGADLFPGLQSLEESRQIMLPGTRDAQ